ncbi:hypothetical protein [Winogradskyella psychrotolerans]|uniref:hypothetical protein n=1 Tax=Winogradskyella psychrotolerans TaxID=1344585 RepID=UPI001C07C29E|nr:hypothetical protein [Winogradskyella psychrotolerans]MBU2927090.1 hypothetical protein [Winogradskyella psychrotolerans]
MKYAVLLPLFLLQMIVHAQSTDTLTSIEKVDDKLLLTIFLKHDQSMNLNEIEKIKTDQAFYENFPSEGVSVVDWYVVMGIGQMVVLELPASKLRTVNVALEKTAWKAFKTEFYTTYNLYPIIEHKLKNKSKVTLDATPSSEKEDDKLLLTVFLKHDQSITLNEIEKIRTDQGFYENIPPEGTSVVNWFVVMGLGQMVVLELPASKLSAVNLAIERTAWKAFTTEIYPTYNLYPFIENKLKNKSKVEH